MLIRLLQNILDQSIQIRVFRNAVNNISIIWVIIGISKNDKYVKEFK